LRTIVDLADIQFGKESRSKARSEFWVARLAIRALGYDRVLKLYQTGSNSLQWFKLLRKENRAALRERRLHIAALKLAPLPDGGIPPAHVPETAQGGMAEHGAAVSAPALGTARTDLKVGVFIPGFLIGKGGAEKVAGKVADLLANSGNKVDLICRPPRRRPPPYLLSEQIRIRPLIEQDDRQIKLLRGENYDLLVGFGMHHFYSRIAHISRLLEVPFVLQECNNPQRIAAGIGGTHLCWSDEEAFWLRQAVFAHAAAIRFTVPAYADSVIDDARPFTYAFYNALVSPGRLSNERDPAKKIICVSSMKNGNKNGMAAVNAFGRFSSRNPGWSLHLYGLNNFRRELDKFLVRFPDAAIFDHGIVDDLDEIYEDAYALIIPSFEEGLPNVVVEALSYGVPCIGFSDCDGVKHIIVHEESGLLVERDNANALDEALRRIADPDFRRLLSTGAKRFAETQLQPEPWEASWLRLIHNSVNGFNNQGQPQIPIAFNSKDQRAARWRSLLDTYLQFGE
jgi:glycosyltransferase involved in cell wall biosynthesis